MLRPETMALIHIKKYQGEVIEVMVKKELVYFNDKGNKYTIRLSEGDTITVMEGWKMTPKKEDFYIFIQELWETVGNATQLDENFIELMYKRLNEGGLRCHI